MTTTLSEAESATAAPRGEFQAGWPVVLACFAAAVFAWGFAAFGPAVYLAELQHQYGWPAATIGSATTVAFIVGAVLLPWVGSAIARFGAHIVLGAGIVLIGIGVIGISQATAPWQLYLWNVLIGFGWAGASSTAISTTLAAHFDRRRGLALSLALTGASAGGFAVAPALVTLSQYAGFRLAVPGMVLGLMLPILPLIWFGLRFSAGSLGREPDRGAIAERLVSMRPSLASRNAALRDRRFWSVAGPFALAITAQVGVMVYQVSYLLPLLGTAGTSVAMVCTSAAGAIGRLALSAVIDNLDQRLVAAATFASQAAGLTLMVTLPQMPVALFAGSVVFGLGMGNVVALPSLIIQREFAASSFAVAVGLSTAIGQIAYSLGPALLGLLHDLSGGYRMTLVACVALQSAASLLVLRRP